jgi:hypothetical protein
VLRAETRVALGFATLTTLITLKNNNITPRPLW